MIYLWSFLIGLKLTIRLLRCELCSWHLFYVWFTVYRKYDRRFCWRRCCSCRWISLYFLSSINQYQFLFICCRKKHYQHRKIPLRCELPLLWSIVNNEVSANEARVPTQLEHITGSLRPAPHLTLSFPALQQIVSGPSTHYSFPGSLGSRSRATEVITYLLLLPVRWSPVFLILGYSLQNQQGLTVASKTKFLVLSTTLF